MANQALLSAEEESILKTLPEDLLLSIVECERLKDVEALLQQRCSAEEKERLLAIAKKRSAHLKRPANKISESLLDLLTPTSYLFLIVDGVFTLVTAITIAAFAAVASIFLAAAAVVGVLYFLAVYKELKKQQAKDNKNCELLAFKNDCAEIYVQKRLNEEIHLFPARPSDKKRNNFWPYVKDWIGTPVLVTGALFYTYYAVTLGLSIAFAGSLLIAGLTGPFGIGAALAVAIGVGIYFGYKKYQANKRNRELKKDIKILEKEFDVRYKSCRTLNRNRLDPNITLKHRSASFVPALEPSVPPGIALMPNSSSIKGNPAKLFHSSGPNPDENGMDTVVNGNTKQHTPKS